MFSAGSRYYTAGMYVITTSDARQLTVLVPPLPSSPAVAGYHRRRDGERLDLIAARYLNDPTAFWRLCDANAAMVPDALGARWFIGVPATGA